MSGSETILGTRNLEGYPFSGKKRKGREPWVVKALDGVGFSMKYREVLGMVGESGCDKSTLGRTILCLHEPTEGQVAHKGKDLVEYGREEIRQMRREFRIIFQDPYSSLNPCMTVGKLICAPLDIFAVGSEKEKEARAVEIMDKVRLPLEFTNRYPHEFSGDQRQGIIIARAPVPDPRLVVCDKPVSALNVSARAQVLNLMMDLQKELDLTYLLTSYDLNVMWHVCDRVMVTYLGNVVEVADKKTLYEDAKHPCTQALLSAIPIPDMDTECSKVRLEGDVSSLSNPPRGCRFHIRYQYAMEKCHVQVPGLGDVGDRHFVTCHLYDG